MRCFIAINLDDPLRKKIASVMRDLMTGKWDVKWIPPENLHITLKFLGEASEDSVRILKDNLSAIAKEHLPFEVKLRGVGVFPDRKRPRVVWIDIIDSRELTILQEEVEYSAISIGFNKETRKFSPHLTIGRIRSLMVVEAFMKAIEPLKDEDFGNIAVNKISLMKSDLKPTGAQYSIVTEFPLTKEGQ
jgi:2'-5' RNA ligase